MGKIVLVMELMSLDSFLRQVFQRYDLTEAKWLQMAALR